MSRTRHRFYCTDLPTPGNLPANAPEAPAADNSEDFAAQLDRGLSVRLDHEESNHARKVLRLREGDEVDLFNGQGTVGRGVVQSLGKSVTVKVLELQQVPPIKPVIVVAAAMPKGPRADAMVAGLCQAGVEAFWPMNCQRSVVTPRETKIEKFRRASVESAKQCGRAYLMEISPPQDFAQVLTAPAAGVKIIAIPGEENERSADKSGLAGDEVVIEKLRNAQQVVIMIGPEGGFTDDEVAQAKAAGATGWQLGPHVMRIEVATAAAGLLARYVTGW